MEGTKEQLEKSLVVLVDKMERNGSRENAKAVNQWIDYLRANGSNIKTILKDMYCFRYTICRQRMHHLRRIASEI